MSDKEILVVTSKVKGFIRKNHGMNLAGDVPDKLSDLIRDMCINAVTNAKDNKRKTVMGKDFRC